MGSQSNFRTSRNDPDTSVRRSVQTISLRKYFPAMPFTLLFFCLNPPTMSHVLLRITLRAPCVRGIVN